MQYDKNNVRDMMFVNWCKRLIKLEKMCHHFHLSLQSGCDATLKRMNRKYTIEEFIDIKNDLNAVTKANISVRITDDFMNAVINNEDWELSFETENGDKLVKKVSAKALFNKLAYNNWNMAEPGILFWDNIENYNLLSEDKEFKYAGVNPCAEEPLPNGGSCLLGSFNLSAYVDEYGYLDYDLFKKDVHTVVKAMNDVLDEGLPLHPLQIQRDTAEKLRQIGIGIMGVADMLIKMNINFLEEELKMMRIKKRLLKEKF